MIQHCFTFCKMRIHDLNGKRLCILGYGKEGRAMEKALEIYAPEAKITIADERTDIRPSNPNHTTHLGSAWNKHLETFDVVIASPGIPPAHIPETNTSTITNTTQIFLDSIGEHVLTIGVTGSKGKSTTASLIHAILQESGRESLLLGNIGNPAIEALCNYPELMDATTAQQSLPFLVLELSSYQLLRMKKSPHIAVLTSFFPEHLNYHGSLEAYRDAKTNIVRFQREEDVVFFNAESVEATEIAAASQGKSMPFTKQDAPVRLEESPLTGKHNLTNIAGAYSVATHLGIEKSHCISAIQHFTPLPHRLTDLGVHAGIRWIDDAISTTPESTIAALHACEGKTTALILGGEDRGFDYQKLGEEIDGSGITIIVLLGSSGNRIAECITNPSIVVTSASSMHEAIQIIKETLTQSTLDTEPPIALLSPASPSYDMYENFEKKGEDFMREI